MAKGYVYILTNPYFRKGIVKIGMSKRPVDTRSKELYNTSVPDRFEEFASISTVKFKEVEKLIHAKGSRISPNIAPSFEKRAHGCFVRRSELQSEGTIRKGVFTKDVAFTSPTVAANIVQGHNSNGQWDWRTSDGKHLCEIGRK